MNISCAFPQPPQHYTLRGTWLDPFRQPHLDPREVGGVLVLTQGTLLAADEGSTLIIVSLRIVG
jgi:hypothetical protein